MKTKSVAGSSLSRDIVRGFAQIGSLGRHGNIAKAVNRSSDNAIRSDWNKVGGDMDRAITKTRTRALEKA